MVIAPERKEVYCCQAIEKAEQKTGVTFQRNFPFLEDIVQNAHDKTLLPRTNMARNVSYLLSHRCSSSQTMTFF